jgi:hypothetical protein
MIPFLDPEPAAAGARGRRLCPVVAVLLASATQKADEPIAAPKGRDHGPPYSSSLQISRFLGVRNGGHDGVHGPLRLCATRLRSR